MPTKDYKTIQAEFRERAKPRFHPKGVKLVYSEPDGTEKEVLNAAPQRAKGKAFQDRSKTKKGATHTVNPPKQIRDFFPPEMTNHDKMVWRKEQREQKRGNI